MSYEFMINNNSRNNKNLFLHIFALVNKIFILQFFIAYKS